MPDPVTTGFTANIASDLTIGVLAFLGRRLQNVLKPDPRRQALIRCYQAMTAALLPDQDPTMEAYRPILKNFFEQPAVEAEMAKLVKGREPDQLTLVEMFEDASSNIEGLPPFDFESQLVAGISAFIDAVEFELELFGAIQTAMQRDIASDVQTLREIAERPGKPTLEIPRDAPAYVKQAIIQLDNPAKAQRKEALDTLLQSSDHPTAREALIGAVVHDIRDVRINAVLNLVQLGDDNLIFKDKNVVQTLIETVHWGETKEARVLALQTLARNRLDDITTGIMLDVFLNKELDLDLREHAAQILGVIKDASIIPHIIEVLNDDRRMRIQVVKILGEIGDASVIPYLTNIFKDWEQAPRALGQAVSRALGKIAEQQVELEIKQKIVSELTNFLNSDDSFFFGKQVIVETLEKIGTQEALDVVKEWQSRQSIGRPTARRPSIG